MEQTEFKITIYSISRFIISLVVIMCTLFILFSYIPLEKNKIISAIKFLFAISISIYFANLLGRAKVKLVFTQEAFLHIWGKKYIFCFEKNIKIPWNTMENYVFEAERTFDSFIIILNNKRRYKINRINFLPIKDDFKKFRKLFPSLANHYLKQEDESKKIEKGVNFYSTKEFKNMYYIIAIPFIILVLFSIFSPKVSLNLGGLSMIAFVLLFYGLQIRNNKKVRKTIKK